MEKWVRMYGYVTPGGDPLWQCPKCQGDVHLYGVESWKNKHHKCNDCGTPLIYPWEKETTKEEES